MSATHQLIPPLTDKVIESLRAGDRAAISGVIYTARDAAHTRMMELLDQGRPLPVELAGQVLYYTGPTPAPAGRPIGAAGPTTARRMDPHTVPLLAAGLKGMIGKGPRDLAVREALRKYRAVYFTATPGAGALLSRHIVAAKVIAFKDLQTEAIHRLEVREFPVIVANDCHGGDIYESGVALYRRP